MSLQILLVGRHPIIMQRALQILRERSLTADVAYDVTDVERLAQQNPYDVIVIGGGVATATRDTIKKFIAEYYPPTKVIEHLGELESLPSDIKRALN